jgi:hypothetical protein
MSPLVVVVVGTVVVVVVETVVVVVVGTVVVVVTVEVELVELVLGGVQCGFVGWETQNPGGGLARLASTVWRPVCEIRTPDKDPAASRAAVAAMRRGLRMRFTPSVAGVLRRLYRPGVEQLE